MNSTSSYVNNYEKNRFINTDVTSFVSSPKKVNFPNNRTVYLIGEVYQVYQKSVELLLHLT
jgi:hypothetical protein